METGSPSKLALLTPEVSAAAGVPVPPGCPSAGKRIRFASTDIAARAGLEISRVVQRRGHVHAECLAEVDFDPDRFSRVSAPGEGVLREVRKEVGDRVRKGETLAVLESAALGEAAARFLETAAELDLRKKAHDREESLRAKGVSSSASVEEALAARTAARAAHARARADLTSLGLTESAIAALAKGGEARASFPIVSPLDGVVVARDCASGERVSPERNLFEVADPSRVQALLDLREQDLPGVRPGQRVVFRPDGLDGRSYPGVLQALGSRVDPGTRTVRARAAIPNADGALRAHLFGTAAIEVESEGEAVFVPATAVQWEGCCHVVFVRSRDDLFLPRRIELGPRNGDEWLVRKGLSGGEEIVTTGSFLLKTELLKGSLGAGCCEPDVKGNGS